MGGRGHRMFWSLDSVFGGNVACMRVAKRSIPYDNVKKVAGTPPSR